MKEPSTEGWEKDITDEQAEVLLLLNESDDSASNVGMEDKEREKRYEDAEKKALEAIAQSGLLVIQQSARWYCKNPTITISKEAQESFSATLPELLDEMEIKAPDFLVKYQARFAMAFICVGMLGDVVKQNNAYKKGRELCEVGDGENTTDTIS